ncbi:transposase [Streptomyces sp. NPDC088551]|uniref:transposase n=1 Tax=Streptomyces sp. NPDC088551 TaxID=3365863 RepID=UPI0037F29374
MALPDPQFSTPRVLGVDDFAIRRGQIYSTVLTCAEAHRVVDVLPTCEAGPPAAWPTSHPGVEIICRDRAGAYTESARRGAPDAPQVADRFHVWQGLGRTVETCAASHRDCGRSPSPSRTLPETTRSESSRPQDNPEPAGRRAEHKKAAHAPVHKLLAQSHSRRATARHLGWGLNTVLRYAKRRTPAGHLPREPAPAQPTGPPQALPGAAIRRGMRQCHPAARRAGCRASPRHLRHGPRTHRHPARSPVPGATATADGAAGDQLAHPPLHGPDQGRPGPA